MSSCLCAFVVAKDSRVQERVGGGGERMSEDIVCTALGLLCYGDGRGSKDSTKWTRGRFIKVLRIVERSVW